MGSRISVTEATAALREWFQASNLEPGARLPSERVLAKQLGFKHYALNRAMGLLIAEGGVVREGYKLFYAPQSPIVSAVSCGLVVYRASVLLKSYSKVAKELGIQLTIHPWESVMEAITILHQLDSRKTEGVLFDPPSGCATSLWEPAFQQLTDHGIPVICMQQSVSEFPCVTGDYFHAMGAAFSHLVLAGHEELAFFTHQPLVPWASNTWKMLCQQYQCRSSASRTLHQINSNTAPENMLLLARRLTEEWSDVTAVVLNLGVGYKPRGIQFLIDELNRRHRHVPKDISLILTEDMPHIQTCIPPVSAMAFNFPLMQETAFRMIQRWVRKKQEPGFPQQSWKIRVEATLALRASTAPPSALLIHQPPAPKSETTHPFQIGWKENPEELKSVLLRPYALTALVSESRFEQINLSQFVNRPLHFRHGWLGDRPLKHFLAGKQVIHGIPFEVLGGAKRTDNGGIVFHSSVNSKVRDQELPKELRIPIGIKGAAIYVLHGCGYALFLHSFATYRFYSNRKRLGEVPLVTLGQPPSDFTDEEVTKAALKANIQDWWTDFPHVDFPHARRVPVDEAENEAILTRYVYLYTLEWINPFPEKTITHMDVSVDPAQPISLGILSVSGLRK